MSDTIVRLFDRPADAVRAIDRLEAMGVDPKHISLVANNSDDWYGSKKVDRDGDGTDDRAEGAGKGAGIGGGCGACGG